MLFDPTQPTKHYVQQAIKNGDGTITCPIDGCGKTFKNGTGMSAHFFSAHYGKKANRGRRAAVQIKADIPQMPGRIVKFCPQCGCDIEKLEMGMYLLQKGK